MKHHSKAFTLIELLIAIAILSVLVGAVIITVVPGERLAVARDDQREVHLNSIWHSVTEMEHIERSLGGCNITEVEKHISSDPEEINLYDCIYPKYITEPLVDPSDPQEYYFNHINDYETGYYISRDENGRISIRAGESETRDVAVGAVPTISVQTDSANPDDFTAILHGTLANRGGNETIDVHFEYSTDGSLSSSSTTSVQNLNATGAFQIEADNLQADTTYYYRAVAEDPSPEPDDPDTGATLSFTTGEALYHDSVTNVTMPSLTYGDNGQLTWDSLSTATDGYDVNIYVNDTLEDSGTAPSNSYTASSSLFSARDSVRGEVRASETSTHYAIDGYSSSNTVTVAEADQDPPPAPTMQSHTTDSITLNPITNGEYRIESGLLGDNTQFTGLSPGTDYTFYQRYKEDDNHNASPESSAVLTTDVPTPDTPTGLSAGTTGSTSISVNWNSSSYADNYELQRSLDGSTGWSTVYDGPNTSHNDTGLDPDTTYYYQVRAKNTTGNSSYSGTVSATTDIPAPDTPTGLSASATGTSSISVNWNSSSYADNYELQRSLDGSTGWSTVYDGPNTSHNDTGLDPDTTYYYQVRAKNTTGNSSYSGTVSATTDIPAPDTPTGLSASATGTSSISVNWNSSSYAESYVLQRSLNQSTWSIIYDGTGTSYNHTGLDSGTTYYYRVRAENTTGNSSWSSTISETTDPEFTLTMNVNGCGSAYDDTGGSPYEPGTVVDIRATTCNYDYFSHWTSSGGGTFGEQYPDPAHGHETTFTMPAADVTVTAHTSDGTTYSNSASNMSCNQVCSNQGMSCVDIGALNGGTGESYVTSQSSGYCLFQSGTCSTTMLDENDQCYDTYVGTVNTWHTKCFCGS